MKSAFFGVLLLLISGISFSQEWPKQKPIQIVVGFAPGATTDTVARIAAQKLQEALGQTFVVENRPGAGGNIATQQVKRAVADGYTLLVTSVAYSVNPSLYSSAGYDPIRDFIPVILGPSTPNIIMVNPALPVKNLAELIELARKQPLSYASSGGGTTTHLSMERLKVAAKIDMTHVPYQPAQAVGAVMGGHTQVGNTSMPPAVPQVKAGKVRALAVTSAQRSPALPEVPTLGELGYSGFDDLTWVGFFVAAGTPPDVVNRLNAELNRIFASADVKDKLGALGLESRPNTSGEFGAFLRDEVAKWARAVKESGAKAD
jgi:tripartite-type tricarboxylate transporter receptor subunit TctC